MAKTKTSKKKEKKTEREREKKYQSIIQVQTQGCHTKFEIQSSLCKCFTSGKQLLQVKTSSSQVKPCHVKSCAFQIRNTNPTKVQWQLKPRQVNNNKLKQTHAQAKTVATSYCFPGSCQENHINLSNHASQYLNMTFEIWNEKPQGTSVHRTITNSSHVNLAPNWQIRIAKPHAETSWNQVKPVTSITSQNTSSQHIKFLTSCMFNWHQWATHSQWICHRIEFQYWNCKLQRRQVCISLILPTGPSFQWSDLRSWRSKTLRV